MDAPRDENYIPASLFESSTNPGNVMPGQIDELTGRILADCPNAVTSVSVATANGFAGSSSGGNTPVLTLSTTITGMLKGNGTAISSATPGTDYEVPLTFSTGLNRTGNTVINTAPDQTVVLNNGTGISITGTYPNFTITNTGGSGDVVGPSSATDNAIARFDTTTGKLLQNSVDVILDSGYFGVNNTGPLSGIHVTGTGVSPTAPTAYTATDQQKSQTIGVQGAGSAYFFAEDVTNDIEVAMGASTNGNAFMGSLTADALELRTSNAARLTIGATGGVDFNSNAITGTSTIDVGNADTTLSRSAAGIIASEGIDIPTISSSHTLTNKTVNLTSNTLTGTITQFNTALSDADFATLAGTETLSGKTLTAPKFVDGGFIADANGNEEIKFTTTASAVNEITVANAATGNAPTVSATGGDTDIGLKLTAKGTGAVESTTKHLFDKNAYFAETDNGNSGTTKTIDWTASNKQKLTRTGSVTLTFTAPSGPCNLLLKFVHENSATAYTVTFPATVKWPGGTALTFTNTANAVDIVSFYYDGSSYFAQGGSNFS